MIAKFLETKTAASVDMRRSYRIGLFGATTLLTLGETCAFSNYRSDTFVTGEVELLAGMTGV